MSTDHENPWWEQAQDYRRSSRGGSAAARRAAARQRSRSVRASGDDRAIRPRQAHQLWEETPLSDQESSARRRRAAEARAAAQRRRARRERVDSYEYQWVDESPFGRNDDDLEVERQQERMERDRYRRARERSRDQGVGHNPRPRPRPRTHPRSQGHPAWRPERLLLYAAILGIFLVFAAVTNSDASAAVQLAPLIP